MNISIKEETLGQRIRAQRIRLVIDTYSNQIWVFHTCIPLSVRAAEIGAEGSSIYQYDPKGKAANVHRTLTEEVLDRGYESWTEDQNDIH